MKARLNLFLVFSIFFAISSCKNGNSTKSDTKDTDSTSQLAYEKDNAGLELPAEFQVVKVAEDIGAARRVVVRKNGDMYVSLNKRKNGKALVALRDTTGNGQADIIEYFGDLGSGTGLRLYKDYLYYGSDTAVVRFKLHQDQLLPDPNFELIASLPPQPVHEAKSLAFDQSGNLYVNVGAPSNSCQEKDRQKGSKGMKPCPLLEKHGGIWKFDAEKRNQKQEDGERFVTGVRNAVALDWNPHSKKLYAVMHGRDQLFHNWGEFYNEKESAELPAEEFLLLKEGANYGWPYVYWDQFDKAFKVAPEYGGDGKKVDTESGYEEPIFSFPGHWAPNGLLFYTADQFPDKYKNGAFIAFHGSWNRAPEPQKGYKVVFVPFDNDLPSSEEYEVFVDNFTGSSGSILSPADAKYRPNGLSQGPDGSLYITDDHSGTLFRVLYTGDSTK